MAKKKQQEVSVINPFVCHECGEPLMPLQQSAGVCPNGHGRVRTHLPKLALLWLADQRKRGRPSMVHLFTAKNNRMLECSVANIPGTFRRHYEMDKHPGRRRSVPKIGDDLPERVIVGVWGKKVRMLEPATNGAT